MQWCLQPCFQLFHIPNAKQTQLHPHQNMTIPSHTSILFLILEQMQTLTTRMVHADQAHVHLNQWEITHFCLSHNKRKLMLVVFLENYLLFVSHKNTQTQITAWICSMQCLAKSLLVPLLLLLYVLLLQVPVWSRHWPWLSNRLTSDILMKLMQLAILFAVCLWYPYIRINLVSLLTSLFLAPIDEDILHSLFY